MSSKYQALGTATNKEKREKGLEGRGGEGRAMQGRRRERQDTAGFKLQIHKE